MSDNLLPCPFCGGTNVAALSAADDYGTFDWKVYCGDCDAFHETEAVAIAAWNRRAVPSRMPIGTGDTVYHVPTAETWIVAGVADTYLWPVGWPPGRANLADCVLMSKATPEEKARLRADLAKAPVDDERRQFALSTGPV